MARLQRFVSNAGILGTAQASIVSLAVVAIVAYSFHVGDGHLTLPAVLLVATAAYVVRGFLVEQVVFTRRLMNAFAIAAIIAIFLFRDQFVVENFWVRFSASVLAAGYIGCYFMLLSDPSIVRDR